MSKKATGIVSYITWIGWIIAFAAGDREGAKFQLNQSLVYWIFSIIFNILSGVINNFIVSAVVSICLLVFWIIGLVHAIKEQDTPIPLIGGITILK